MRNRIAAIIAAVALALPALAADPTGAPAPQFTLGARSGQNVSLAQYKGQVVMLNFWASWCGPCRQIAPALEEIAGRLGDKVKIVKLNVDENPRTAQKYNIMSIPTLMLFKKGELASSQVGAAPKAKLEQWITAAV